MDFGNPYATRLLVGNPAGTSIEIYASTAATILVALYNSAHTLVGYLEWDDRSASYLGAPSGAVSLRAEDVQLSMTAKGGVYLLSEGNTPTAVGAGSARYGTVLDAWKPNTARQPNQARLSVLAGDDTSARPRIEALLIGNEAGPPAVWMPGIVPIIPSPAGGAQIYAQAGVLGGSYAPGIGGSTVAYGYQFPNATIAAIAQWGASGGVYVSTWGFTASGFRAQCFVGAAELGATGQNLQWMAWGY